MPPLPHASHFFGYGSLVNRATHVYAEATPARLHGWRRVWVHTDARPLAYLSVQPDPDCTIDGLIARVPDGNWAALDLREAAYARNPVMARPLQGAAMAAQVYAVPQVASGPKATHPILLSYLDAVVQGFLREFGAEGVAAFFTTTSGWEAPVLNDRAAPRYPRAQRLSGVEVAAVDKAVTALSVKILTDRT